MNKILLALLLVCHVSHAGEYLALAPRVDYYEAQRPIEIITSIPAVNYSLGQDRHFRRVAHVMIPDVKPGDILSIASSFEITNDLPTLVEFVAGLVLTPDATGAAGVELLSSLSGQTQSASGKFITQFSGYNLTPNQNANFPNGAMHHGIFPLNAVYRVPEGVSGDQYVAIISYVAGLQHWPTSQTVKVEPYAGWLQVKRERN
jgi:hypothetical protein